MNKAVKQEYVVDITDLGDEFEGLYRELLDRLEDVGQNTYVDISVDWLEETFYDYYDDEGNFTLNEEYVNKYPVLYKLLQSIENGEFPKEFILLIWW